MTDARTLTHSLGGYWKNGRGQAPCPICQSERRPHQLALSISQQSEKLLLYCFKAQCSFVEIARVTDMPLGPAQIDLEAHQHAGKEQAKYQAAQLAKARALWDACSPIAGTRAEAYLRGRRITCAIPECLRFSAAVLHAPSLNRCSAMVANVEPIGGVHRTFLDETGNRLSQSAKMMLGPCAGGAVRLSEAEGPLVVCEGIETGLSLLSGLLGGPAGVWACLSTSGMKSLQLPEAPDRLIIASDGDEAGRAAASALAERAHMLGWQVSLLPAPEGRDWNDVLTGHGVAA